MRRLACGTLGLVALLGAVGCTVGDGSGEVKTKEGAHLYVNGCWNGPFDLKPDFFAANPYRNEALFIRVQRGDNNEEASDGLIVTVSDLDAVKQAVKAKQSIPVGLPNGVAPPGQPLTGKPPALVSLSLYLHQTCHEQQRHLLGERGHHLRLDFSGNLNEEDSDARFTKATFDVTFADPRDLVDATDVTAVSSEVQGNFQFFFQRGQPAQPFQ